MYDEENEPINAVSTKIDSGLLGFCFLRNAECKVQSCLKVVT
jgi:hypothetical protein